MIGPVSEKGSDSREILEAAKRLHDVTQNDMDTSAEDQQISIGDGSNRKP